MKNEATLEKLFQNGWIELDRGALIDRVVAPKPESFDFDRVEGMLLGVAIGDALGFPSERYSPRERRRLFGEIRDYLYIAGENSSRGIPSDDTQLTFWTLEQLLEDRGLIPENLANRFATGGEIFGIGRTVRDFLRNLKSGGKPWYLAGPRSAGNGALMRISPMIIPHLRRGGTGPWVDTALSAMMTHNDRASTSASLAISAMLWELLDMEEPPEPVWWLARYVEIARDLEGETRYRPRTDRFGQYEGPLWKYAGQCLDWAESQFISTLDACNAWGSSAYLMETIPSVLLLLTRYAHDPEEALVRAVNDTWDNDTIAAITGGMLGALHGRQGLPERWIERLSGRTGIDDDGKVFRLIEKTKQRFFEFESC